MTATGPASVAQLMAHARAAGVDRLDAQLLLGHVIGRPRAWLIAHDDAPVDPEPAAQAMRLVAERGRGVPLAYLVGQREFHGLDLEVSPAVLVPRPDTELLVDWAIELLATVLADRPSPDVVDLGTGSGAIALAVAKGCPRARVTATDRSPDALAVAAGNARRLGLAQVRIAAGDWWHAVAQQGPFDLALSNPPYIAAHDSHLAALVHEPLAALTPGGDGLGALRAIVAGAWPHLRPGSWLLLEHGWDQAGEVASLLRNAGFTDIATRHDLQAHPRCTGGRRGNTR